MFKNKLVLEVKGNDDRNYIFECPPNAPLGEVHDALFTMRSTVIKQINDIYLEEEKKQKEKKDEEAKA